MGVGHPSLDRIHTIAKEYNLSSKLTGAGGGGCAFILLADDFTDSNRNELQQKLADEGIQSWTACLGGPGVQILQVEDIT